MKTSIIAQFIEGARFEDHSRVIIATSRIIEASHIRNDMVRLAYAGEDGPRAIYCSFDDAREACLPVPRAWCDNP